MRRGNDTLLKKYRFGFDIWGLILFLVIMIPNFIWFAVPAPNDVLRNDSVTGTIDAIGSVFQVIMIASLCLIINKERKKLSFTPLIISSIICVVIYFSGWVMYYTSLTGPFVIMLLTIPPCLAFILWALDRKNYIAVIPAICFTVCHLIFGVVNFIM